MPGNQLCILRRRDTHLAYSFCGIPLDPPPYWDGLEEAETALAGGWLVCPICLEVARREKERQG